MSGIFLIDALWQMIMIAVMYDDYGRIERNTTVNVSGVGMDFGYAYDDAGNLIRDHRGYGYIYAYENRFVQVYKDLNSNGVYEEGRDVNLAVYTYDALGRRIEKANPLDNTAQRYYYDDQRVAVQTLVSGGVETDDRYFVFGNYIDEVLVMHEGAGGLYYGHDHLYSPTVLYGSTGIAVERYEYDAYGSVQILTSAFYPLASSQYGNPYTFTGRELDTMDNNTLHLMHCRARTYDPETGRFMQRDLLGVNPAVSKMPIDPIGQYYDSLSLYEYVSSKPLVELDPSGTKIEVIKKQHTNESSIPGTRGMVTSTLSGNFKCKKKWFSCKAKLILDITGTIDLYLLQIGHRDWSDDPPHHTNRYPRYHTKWGNPRSDLAERYAARSHELDHWYTSEAFWSNTKSSASPFDGKIYNDTATCQTAGLCIMSAVGNYWGLAMAHSVSFDFNPLRQGGMYSTNPFVVTLSLSHCP